MVVWVRSSAPAALCRTPKLGTVTNDVAKAIEELKGGRVEYRADRYGIAHVIIGKVSFTPEQLAENYGAVYDEIPAHEAVCRWTKCVSGQPSSRQVDSLFPTR